jgi:Domain of unknown function (DUF3854)
MNLRDSDVEVFQRLRIPPQLIEQAGIARVTDGEAREIYGIKGGGICPESHSPTLRLKRWPMGDAVGTSASAVIILRSRTGRLSKKYVAPYGDRKHLYFPPSLELFADVTVPIVLVEAEKSALALTAWAERNERRILALGIGGCWGWCGQTGIRETATGERVPEHGAIADLNICRDGRKTYVLLDSNCATNPKVQQARAALARQLQKQGADIAILDLPASDGVNGPDDFLGLCGDQAMTDLLEGAGTGAKILDDIEAFLRRFLVITGAQVTATALWCAHTYCFQAFLYTPYLAVTSAEKRCGKSRVLEAVGFLVRRRWMTSGASAASLYREIDETRPTLLLDEVDRLLKGDKEFAQAVTAVLNAGAHHKGTVSRCVGEGAKQKNKNYRCFCPKAIAGIGSLSDTVADRSIHLRVQRKLASQKVERLREKLIGQQATELRQRRGLDHNAITSTAGS